MFTSTLNVLPYHVAANRWLPTARCSPRTSVVTSVHCQVFAPVVVTDAYAGGLLASFTITKPSAPDAPRQLPRLVVSAPINVAAVPPPPPPAPTVMCTGDDTERSP